MNDSYVDEDLRPKYLHGCSTKLTVDQKFRRILHLLRKDFPPEYPVKVRRISESLSGPDAPYGYCTLVHENGEKTKRYFLIKLSKSNTWHHQFNTILHEWAHCLTWHLVGEKDHGDVFHRKHGVLYRRYVED